MLLNRANGKCQVNQAVYRLKRGAGANNEDVCS
jgi:hypothetical protein